MNKIYHNGNIYTMDKHNTIAEAVLTVDNKIQLVGTNEQVLVEKGNGTELIDLKGKTVVPGFNDSHMHLMMYGKSLNEVDLRGVGSAGELIRRGKEFLIDKPMESNQWIVGAGWDQEAFNNKIMPDRYDLDKISMDIPIMFSRVCHHVAVCNTKALEIAGIAEDTIIDGGEIEKENGVLTGILRENAVRYLRQYSQKMDRGEKRKNILAGMDKLSTFGITSVQTDDILSNDASEIMGIYRELQSNGKMKVRVYQQCRFATPEKFTLSLQRGNIFGENGPDYRIGALKLLVDGTLGARTAAMNASYADDYGNYGMLNISEQALDCMVGIAHCHNIPVVIHAIGDKAIDIAINSIEKAQKAEPKDDMRHGIIHCQITSKQALDRIAKNNILALIQPIFVANDLKIVEKRIGKEKARYAYNWKTLMQNGVVVTFGTDCPIESPNPFNNIYCAVNRCDLNGDPTGGWIPEEKLTIAESLKAYTVNSAFGTYEENMKGSIESGKYADMVVLSENIFKINPLEIKNLECIMTIKGGDVVYKR